MKPLVLLLFVTSLYAKPSDQEIEATLKEAAAEIVAYKALYSKQIAAINDFAEKGPQVSLKYDGSQYIVESKGEVEVWGKDLNRKLFLVKKATVTKTETYKFKEYELNDRPHGYIGNVFKFGAGAFYDKAENKVNPDALLMYEFFSFDPLFSKLQGISFNACAGLRHVGGTIGYQFVGTRWFRNTSINFGYSYQFLTQTTEPFFALSLNF